MKHSSCRRALTGSLLLALVGSSVHAATIVVTTADEAIDAGECDSEAPADTVDLLALCPDGDGGALEPCDAAGISLREAICAANANPGPDTIVLAAGETYSLTTRHNSWYGHNALPAVFSEIIIEGNGAVIQRPSSAPTMRLFFVSGAFTESEAPAVGQSAPAGSLTLRDLTLQGGEIKGGAGGINSISGGGGGGGAGLGGAILNAGTLILERVTLTDNAANGGDGGAWTTPGVPYDSGGGGGLAGKGENAGGGFGATPDASFADPGGFADGPAFGGGGVLGGDGGFGGGGGGTFSGNGGDGGFGGGGGGSASGAAGNGGFGGGGGGTDTGQPGYGGVGGGLGGMDPLYDYAFGGGGAGMGGAVFNLGTLKAVNSTFAFNGTAGGSSFKFDNWGRGLGGALFTYGGEVEVRSSTFAGNVVGEGSVGGAIATYDPGTPPVVIVDHCLFWDLYGGLTGLPEPYIFSFGSMSASGGENLFAEFSPAAFGVLSTADPDLGDLGDNGGPTPTIALGSGAPTSTTPCTDLSGASLLIDQRGWPRPTDTCDPGAFQRPSACPGGDACADAGPEPGPEAVDAPADSEPVAELAEAVEIVEPVDPMPEPSVEEVDAAEQADVVETSEVEVSGDGEVIEQSDVAEVAETGADTDDEDVAPDVPDAVVDAADVSETADGDVGVADVTDSADGDVGVADAADIVDDGGAGDPDADTSGEDVSASLDGQDDTPPSPDTAGDPAPGDLDPDIGAGGSGGEDDDGCAAADGPGDGTSWPIWLLVASALAVVRRRFA